MRQKGTMRSCRKYATEVIDVYYALTRREGDVLNPQFIGGYKINYNIGHKWPIHNSGFTSWMETEFHFRCKDTTFFRNMQISRKKNVKC